MRTSFYEPYKFDSLRPIALTVDVYYDGPQCGVLSFNGKSYYYLWEGPEGPEDLHDYFKIVNVSLRADHKYFDQDRYPTIKILHKFYGPEFEKNYPTILKFFYNDIDWSQVLK